MDSRTEHGARGRITTHVLDTGTGRPAAGLPLRLLRREPSGWVELGRFRTDADGRCAAPLLEGEALQAGCYEILFEVSAWRDVHPGEPGHAHAAGDAEAPSAASFGRGFYDTIPIRFRVTDPGAHHHVPLILAPFGYSTYRGS